MPCSASFNLLSLLFFYSYSERNVIFFIIIVLLSTVEFSKQWSFLFLTVEKKQSDEWKCEKIQRKRDLIQGHILKIAGFLIFSPFPND